MSKSGPYDENKLRKYFETLINDISRTLEDISALKKNDSDEPILQNLQKRIQTSFEKSLPAPSGNYLLRVLNKHHYNDQTKTFTFSLTAERLPIFSQDLKSYLALFDACQGAWDGNLTVVKDFFDAHFRLKDASGPRKTTLLYSAARNNHMNIVVYLIETGHCSVNAQNEEYLSKGQPPTMSAAIGSTALHAACYQGHLQIVKYLIEHGGDYFLLNSMHETPFDNGQAKPNIRAFFSDLLLSGYSKVSDPVPSRTILNSLEKHPEPWSDCFWEYKLLTDDRWIPFTSNLPDQLQRALLAQSFQAEIESKSARDMYHISLAQFLRTGKNNELAWIRCRGSSLLNLQAYSQWQMMFSKHPIGLASSSISKEVLQISTKKKIQLQTWYNFDVNMNFVIETAMNYRRRYLNMTLDFLNQEKIRFDLETFTFTNQQSTIEGSLRWIPKLIINDRKFTVVDNFKLPQKGELAILTVARLRQTENDQILPKDIQDAYQLKAEDAFKNDELDFATATSTISKNPSGNTIQVLHGDLLVNQSDVLVICSSSQYLFNSVMKAGGKSLKQSFDAQVHQSGKNSHLVSVPASGQLNSKAVYFVRWEPNPDPNRLCRSIEQLVTSVMEMAAQENYHSVAFPAIGCGEYGCSVDLVAQTLVRQVQRQLLHRPINVLFVIQPDRKDIFDEFLKQIHPSDFHEHKPTSAVQSSITLDKGSIAIVKEDITQQEADVIIGSSSSENLKQILLTAAGQEVRTAYEHEFENNPNLLIISTPPGQLKCKRIFFLKWEPDSDEEVLQQSIVDMIWNLVQNVLSHNFTSIAFPAIGCGEHACSVETVVKTTVREMKKQIQKRKLPWRVKFVIHQNQLNVYEEFCRQLLSSTDEAVEYQVPDTWQGANDDSMRALVAKNSEEYRLLVSDFDKTMRGRYKQVIRIERIQNERWYMQYVAHARDFKKRLNEDTEQHLYHGCPETAANAILQDCFNRSFAGVNGIAFGVGVYFSANAAYSHGFTKTNHNGERHMFVARVLVGKTIIGNSSMKTRPLGYDSTTDGKEIFVTYHDAQAYAEYLITYK